MTQLDELGHELALHGNHHIDNTQFTPDEFKTIIQDSRRQLEDIVGKPVIGYRAANLVLSIRPACSARRGGLQLQFLVCPARKFFGKFANMTNAPTIPYYPSAHDLAVAGDMRILELPLGVMPIAKNSMFHRRRRTCPRCMVGNARGTCDAAQWVRFLLLPSLRGRPVIRPPTGSPYVRLFLRNVGVRFRRQLSSLLTTLQATRRVYAGA